MVHALSGECPCSVSMVDYLVGRRATPAVGEQVLLVDGTARLVASLEAAGFSVVQLDEASLAATYGSRRPPRVRPPRPCRSSGAR
ncbi:MAG: hypothetical protein EXR76_16920 [Myxococcales bacterium]|nr:hypothetical protein [Myxococcales bacterium]